VHRREAALIGYNRAMKLGQVMVFAKDLERLRRFYAGGFGLTAVEDAAGWVRFAAGSAFFALHALPDEIARCIEIAEPPAPRAETAIKFTFHVDDVDATRAHLAAHGAVMREPRTWGGRTYCDGVDPEGNVFQIANG
jgi:catechol 2,3-dioxygenase-like lactoylglutathione lyase family enzyme